LVWIALGIVYLVWGSTYFAIAIVVQTLPPLLTAGVRFLLAGLLLAAWVAARRPGALRVTRRQAAGAALVGVLLLAGGNGLVSLGEQTVPSGLAALIVASVPLWIVLLRLAARDRVGRDVITGVSVGIVGVAVLVVPSGLAGQTDPLGLAMLVGATFAWATGTFASPRLTMPGDALASTALQMLAAGIVLLVIGGIAGERIDATKVSASSLVAFGYLVVFGSLVAFSAYTWLLQRAPVSLVSTYAYVNPVVAVFLGTLFLSEPVRPTMIAGAALILAAVAFIVSRAQSSR
jgi:drug/metabolite transporter (DMT)-like permease